MSKIGLALALTMVVLATAGQANAIDISAKKIMISRQIRVSSRDGAIVVPYDANPSAAIHVYSATDNFCFKLPAGRGWTDAGSSWHYEDELTGNVASVKKGKLAM